VAGGPEAGAVGRLVAARKWSNPRFSGFAPGYDNKIPDGPAVEKTTQTPKI